MRITLKISLLTTAWMLLTLIIINIIVFILFMKTTVDMEKDTTIQKADDIVKYFQAETDYTPEQINSKLKALLTEHSYIRILQADNQVLYEVTNEKSLAEKIKGKYVDTQESERRGISLAKKEKQVLIVRVPLKEGLHVKGSLEIGKELIGLESRKDILLWILVVSSLLAVILSLLSGRWLANIIMRPITNMIQTMEDIERSSIPKKIIIHSETRDELQTLANTFNLMIDRLEENFEKQSRFVSDASHELKTPLTVIKSYANLLRRHGLKDQEMADEAIQAIHTEATRIQKMTETFLDVASLEKEVELEMNLVNLVSLCQSILKQLKHVYKRDIILHFEESPILILADELKIKQVIIILLDNAIKYSNKNIDVFLKKMEGNAIVCVEDHGIGIPQEEIENIFERFYRVDKARSRETGGSGLGLHIANRIVKLHKGEITLKSKEGEGTKVILHLPAGLELL